MEFDVAVIGGGINGVFTALDLVLRGLKVILLERGAIGSGTS
ncbi:FAD-dependent oxidoreductase [Vulcanisaeta sp. JCM 14467]|nr:FAD-dependent oxidoreductase [Vulcanisaeta sp. JCM 14467]